MVLVCAISGFPPEDPVISKDGYLFERRLIQKAIEDNGTCPITGGPLTLDDLKQVNASNPTKAIPVDSSSLPGILDMFEKEWDRILLEQYELKAQLNSVQEELAKALYEHEGAVRTIARLTRERDEALSTQQQ